MFKHKKISPENGEDLCLIRILRLISDLTESVPVRTFTILVTFLVSQD